MMEDEGAWEFRLGVLENLRQLRGADMWTALETARQLEELVPSKGAAKAAAAEESAVFQPDLNGLLDIAASYYRDAMILAAGAGYEAVSNCDCGEDLRNLAEARGAMRLEKDLQRLQEAYEHLGGNVQPRLWLQHMCLGLAEA